MVYHRRSRHGGRSGLIFTGTYEHAIDSKNRLAIPSSIRYQIQRVAGAGEGDAVFLYVALGEGRTLCLYTEEGFEQRANDLDQSELDSDQLLMYERLFFSLAKRVELDRQGRVRLPDDLLRRSKLGRRVVLLGVKDHMEIRDRDWHEYVDQALKQDALATMNPRRAMRKPGTPGLG